MSICDQDGMLFTEKRIERFLRVEDELDLFSWQVKGLPMWELNRFPIFQVCNGQYGKSVVSIVATRFWYRGVLNLFKVLFLTFKVPKGAVIVFPHDRLTKEKVARDLYSVDLCLRNREVNYVMLVKKGRSLVHENLIYLNVSQVFGLLRLIGLIAGRVFKVLGVFEEKIDKIVDSLDGIDKGHINKLVYNNFAYALLLKSLFSFVFKRWGVSKLIEVVYYRLEVQVANVISKKLDIPIVELQHGTIGKTHVAYNIDWVGCKTVPDFFLSWGRFWSLRFNIHRVETVDIGYSELDRYLGESKNKEVTSSERRKVLVVSQNRLDILKLAHEISQMCTEMDIIYRLHPKEVRIKDFPYGKLFFQESSANLYEAIERSSFIVGVSSTVLVEALAFDKQVLVAELSGYTSFIDLIESGVFLSFNNVESFYNEVQVSKRNNSFRSSDYFTKVNYELIKNYV
jgi:hypothetical protein